MYYVYVVLTFLAVSALVLLALSLWTGCSEDDRQERETRQSRGAAWRVTESLFTANERLSPL